MGAWIETYGGRIMTPMEIVAPYVGAWIETSRQPLCRGFYLVAPYVGAWIETSVVDFIVMVIMGRTLCGCVD